MKSRITDSIAGTNELMKRIQQEQQERRAQTADMLKSFREKLAADTAQLRESTKKSREERSAQTAETLKGFRKELASKIGVESKRLFTEIGKAKEERKKEVDQMLKNFREELSSETDTMMKNFKEEHKKLIDELKASSLELKSSLADAEKNRMSNYNEMMGQIRDQLKNIFDYVEGLLAESNAAIKQKKNKTKKVPKTAPAKIHVKEEQHEVVAEEESTPTEESKKEYGHEELKKMILDLVKKHPEDGIKVKEMEDAIGVSKLLLGKIAKEMYEEEEIGNENGRYYPLS